MQELLKKIDTILEILANPVSEKVKSDLEKTLQILKSELTLLDKEFDYENNNKSIHKEIMDILRKVNTFRGLG